MTVRQRLPREERRRALLDAAGDLVAESGVAAFSFESLAARAGVAKTLPYAYFDSADDVLGALFDEVVGDLDQRIEAVVGAGGALGDLLRRSLDVWFDAARSQGRLIDALLDGRAAPALADRVHRRDRRSRRLWHDVLAQQDGLGDLHAHVLAVMLTDGATGVVKLWVSRKGSRSDLEDAFVTMALGAIDAVRTGAPRA